MQIKLNLEDINIQSFVTGVVSSNPYVVTNPNTPNNTLVGGEPGTAINNSCGPGSCAMGTCGNGESCGLVSCGGTCPNNGTCQVSCPPPCNTFDNPTCIASQTVCMASCVGESCGGTCPPNTSNPQNCMGSANTCQGATCNVSNCNNGTCGNNTCINPTCNGALTCYNCSVWCTKVEALCCYTRPATCGPTCAINVETCACPTSLVQ